MVEEKEEDMEEEKEEDMEKDKQIPFPFGKEMFEKLGIEGAKNIGILDLRHATTEDIEKMEEMVNVGVIIVPEELVGKVSSKIKTNIGVIVPYVEGMRIFTGETTFNAAMLEALDEPISFIHAGELTIDSDVTPELIKNKIKSFRNYGETLVPAAAYGALMAKCIENAGEIKKS
jgi:hypothetical protein